MPHLNLNWKVIMSTGLIAGLLQAATGVAMYVSGVYFAQWSMLPSLIVLLACIVVGITRYRKEYLGGSITYGKALIIGICVSVGTGVVYAVYNIVSISFFYPNFINEMINAVVAGRSGGLSDAQVAELTNSLKEGTTTTAIAIGNLIRLSVFGTVISLVASVFLKNNPTTQDSNERH